MVNIDIYISMVMVLVVDAILLDRNIIISQKRK